MPDSSLKVFLGTDASSRSEFTHDAVPNDAYWHPLSENSPHLAITGSSGTGKTETLKRICFELKKKGIPTVIIDFHDEFGVLADNLISLDNATIHPLEVQRGEKPKDAKLKVADIFAKSYGLGIQQKGILKEAIEQFYLDSGIREMDRKSDGEAKLLRFSVFRETLRAACDIAKKKDLYYRLEEVFESDIFMNAERTVFPFETIWSGVSVIQLKDVQTDEMKQLIAEIFLKKLRDCAYMQGHASGMRLFCVIDEAHRMVYDGSPLDSLLRESRKYGVGIILASQQSSDFSEIVTNNVGAILAFQCSAKDARRISSIIRVDPFDFETLTEKGFCFMWSFSANGSQKIKIARVEDRKEDYDALLKSETRFNETELRAKAEDELRRIKEKSSAVEEYENLRKSVVPSLENELRSAKESLRLASSKTEQLEAYTKALKDAYLDAIHNFLSPAEAKALAISYMERGVSKHKAGDLLGALAEFELALDCDPKCAKAYHHRGVLRYILGAEKEAESDIAKSVELDPSLPDFSAVKRQHAPKF